MTSTAVLMPNWIGDLLLALSVVCRKSEAAGDAMTLVVPERLSGLTKLLCDFPVIPYRRANRHEYAATLRAVRAASLTKLYILPHSFSSGLFAFRTGVSSRRGVSMELRRFLLTEPLPATLSRRDRHLTNEYAEVLEAGPFEASAWKGAALKVAAGASEAHPGSLVLCPGAAYGPAKQWPHFERLPLLFPEKKFVILGDVRDRDAADRVASRAPDRITNLAGVTSLEQAAAIIAAASVVVSNDSGLLHLAGFLGTPCVGIYGSTSSVWTCPLGSAVRIALGSCQRRPCYERACPEKHCNCLYNIQPEVVAELARDILR